MARIRTQRSKVRRRRPRAASRATAYKWLARFREAVWRVGSRLAAPALSASDPPSRETQIWRCGRRLECAAITWRMGVARATVGDVLRRHGLGACPRSPAALVQRSTGTAGRASAHRHQVLGRVGAVGHRVAGRLQDRVRGFGWEQVHITVDDRSRLAYVEVLPAPRKHDAAAFVARALAWFRRRRRAGRATHDGRRLASSLPFLAVCGRTASLPPHAALHAHGATERPDALRPDPCSTSRPTPHPRLSSAGAPPGASARGADSTTAAGPTPRSAIAGRRPALPLSRREQRCNDS